MEKNMKHVDVLNEGKKVARLVANRDLDPKNVKQKKESLKKCGVLTPAVIVNGNKAVEQDLEIVDFITGELFLKRMLISILYWLREIIGIKHIWNC